MKASTAPPNARNDGYGAPTRRAIAARTTATSRTARSDSNPDTGEEDYRTRIPADPIRVPTRNAKSPSSHAARSRRPAKVPLQEDSLTLATGTRLGAYEILAPIGAGGMGEVYRARDSKLDRDVAIKVLPSTVANDADTLSRFEREAKAVAALSHPNILAIHDFGRH